MYLSLPSTQVLKVFASLRVDCMCSHHYVECTVISIGACIICSSAFAMQSALVPMCTPLYTCSRMSFVSAHASSPHNNQLHAHVYVMLQAYLNDRLMVVGGERFSVPLDHNTGIRSVEWYDPATDCWTDSRALFDLPYPRFRFPAAAYPADNKLFVFGGQSPAVNGAWPIEEDVFWYRETLADTVSGGGDTTGNAAPGGGGDSGSTGSSSRCGVAAGVVGLVTAVVAALLA